MVLQLVRLSMRLIWPELIYLHCNTSSWNFQGRVIPCDFIGVVKSQQPVYLKGT